MKKFFFSIFLLASLLFVSCGDHSFHVVRRIKSNLDLTYSTTDLNYQYSWTVLKNLDDETDEFNKGDSVYIKMKGTPEQNLPAIKGYFAEKRDPQLNSREDYEASKEEDSEYVATPSEWVQITEEFNLFEQAAGETEFETEISLTFEYDVLDNKNTVLFFYLNPDELDENYFDYYEKQLEEAVETAQKMAEEKAEKQNKKESLTETDKGYHTASEYYTKIYQTLLDEIGAKRIKINDVTLHLEIINN